MSPGYAPVAPALGPFVDAELAVINVVSDMVASDVDIETPSNLQDVLPFIRVTRIGGQSTQMSDSPRIDVDVFGAAGSRTDTKNLALAVQARLLSFPHVLDGVGVIDRVDTDVSPNQVPWNNARVLLFTSSYKVSVRR